MYYRWICLTKPLCDQEFLMLQSSLPQNVKQANAAFEALLDILQLQMRRRADLQLPVSYVESARLSFREIAGQALSLGESSCQPQINP